MVSYKPNPLASVFDEIASSYHQQIQQTQTQEYTNSNSHELLNETSHIPSTNISQEYTHGEYSNGEEYSNRGEYTNGNEQFQNVEYQDNSTFQENVYQDNIYQQDYASYADDTFVSYSGGNDTNPIQQSSDYDFYSNNQGYYSQQGGSIVPQNGYEEYPYLFGENQVNQGEYNSNEYTNHTNEYSNHTNEYSNNTNGYSNHTNEYSSNVYPNHVNEYNEYQDQSYSQPIETPLPAQPKELQYEQQVQYRQPLMDPIQLETQIDTLTVKEQKIEKRIKGHAIATFGPGGILIITKPTFHELFERDIYTGSSKRVTRASPGPISIESVSKYLYPSVLNIYKSIPTPFIGTKIKMKKSDLLESLGLLSKELGLGENDNLLVQLMKLLIENDGILLGSKNESSLLVKLKEILLDSNFDSSQHPLFHVLNLLLDGKIHEACNVALQDSLWTHAFLISNHIDKNYYSNLVIQYSCLFQTGFTSLQSETPLTIEDADALIPLQVLYRVFAGQGSEAIVENSVSHWKSILLLLLCYRPDLSAITALGDVLYNQGMILESHFCYLLCFTHVNVQEMDLNRMNLILENSKNPLSIQWTLIYEYAVCTNSSRTLLPHFQVYKFAYAMELADLGLLDEAVDHFEALNRLLRGGKDVEFHLELLFHTIQEYADRLCIKNKKKGSTSKEGWFTTALGRGLDNLISAAVGENVTSPEIMQKQQKYEGSRFNIPVLSSLASQESSNEGIIPRRNVLLQEYNQFRNSVASSDASFGSFGGNGVASDVGSSDFGYSETPSVPSVSMIGSNGSNGPNGPLLGFSGSTGSSVQGSTGQGGGVSNSLELLKPPSRHSTPPINASKQNGMISKQTKQGFISSSLSNSIRPPIQPLQPQPVPPVQPMPRQVSQVQPFPQPVLQPFPQPIQQPIQPISTKPIKQPTLEQVQPIQPIQQKQKQSVVQEPIEQEEDFGFGNNSLSKNKNNNQPQDNYKKNIQEQESTQQSQDQTHEQDQTSKEKEKGNLITNLIGSFWGSNSNEGTPKAKQIHLGEKMDAYFDEKSGRWVFPNSTPTETASPLPPPPTKAPPPSKNPSVQPSPSVTPGTVSPVPSLNPSFTNSKTRRSARSKYVDVINPNSHVESTPVLNLNPSYPSTSTSQREPFIPVPPVVTAPSNVSQPVTRPPYSQGPSQGPSQGIGIKPPVIPSNNNLNSSMMNRNIKSTSNTLPGRPYSTKSPSPGSASPNLTRLGSTIRVSNTSRIIKPVNSRGNSSPNLSFRAPADL